MKDLTVAEVIKRLEEAEVGKGTTVIYSGGEPTIYKEIIYLIRYASEKGAKVRLLTNCIKFADFLTSHLGIRLEKIGCIVSFNRVTKMLNERENYVGIVKRGLTEEWCKTSSNLGMIFA